MRSEATSNIAWLAANNGTADLSTDTNHLGILANLTPWTVVMSMAATLLLVATAHGNALVCLAIALDKRLQNKTNIFLMSLAVADFMVALTVMPFGILVLLTGRFPLPAIYCTIYITVGNLFCNSSVLHLSTLSVDRYLSLRYPMMFGRIKTRRRVVIKICLVWTVSAIFCVLPIDQQKPLTTGQCSICQQNHARMIISLICVFYAPMLVMVVVHILTMRLLRRTKATKSPRNLSRNPENRTRTTIFTVESAINREGFEQTVITAGSKVEAEVTHETLNGVVEPPTRVKFFKCSSRHWQRAKPKSGRYHRSEKRATKVLNIIFFTFVVLWTPFVIFSITAISYPTCVPKMPHAFLDTSLWLGLASSTANPVIYTIFNPTFRETFVNLLHLRLT